MLIIDGLIGNLKETICLIMQAKLKKMLTWVPVSKESLFFIINQWRPVGKMAALVCFPQVTSRTLFSIMWEAWKRSCVPECVLRCVASQHPTISHVAEDRKDDPLSISYLGYASVPARGIFLLCRCGKPKCKRWFLRGAHTSEGQVLTESSLVVPQCC